jgi:hypothetical protein
VELDEQYLRFEIKKENRKNKEVSSKRQEIHSIEQDEKEFIKEKRKLIYGEKTTYN